MFQIQGGAYFRTDLKWLVQKISMLKSNFKLVGRKFVRGFKQRDKNKQFKLSRPGNVFLKLRTFLDLQGPWELLLIALTK